MGLKIYKVEYFEKYKGSADWGKNEMNVAVRGNAETAIKRARRNVVGKRLHDHNWINGRKIVKVYQVTDFDPIGVELLAEAEC